MADITEISSEQDFTLEVVSDDDIEITDDGAAELWRIWTYRYENGATDDVLVTLPRWFAEEELGKNHPYFFASIEHDDPDSGAILFADARLVDANVVENGLWDDVTITETLETIDISEDDDYIDEAGKIWIPRSLMTIYERSD